MNETKKIEKLFSMYSDKDIDESFISFLEEFDAFLQEMSIPQSKKHLIMYYEDSKPCMLNINS